MHIICSCTPHTHMYRPPPPPNHLKQKHSDLQRALEFCCALQVGCLSLEWPTEVLAWEGCGVALDPTTEQVVWRGLQVSCGVSWGLAAQRKPLNTGMWCVCGGLYACMCVCVWHVCVCGVCREWCTCIVCAVNNTYYSMRTVRDTHHLCICTYFHIHTHTHHIRTGHADYFGTQANLAARLMASASPGQILVQHTNALCMLTHPLPHAIATLPRIQSLVNATAPVNASVERSTFSGGGGLEDGLTMWGKLSQALPSMSLSTSRSGGGGGGDGVIIMQPDPVHAEVGNGGAYGVGESQGVQQTLPSVAVLMAAQHSHDRMVGGSVTGVQGSQVSVPRRSGMMMMMVVVVFMVGGCLVVGVGGGGCLAYIPHIHTTHAYHTYIPHMHTTCTYIPYLHTTDSTHTQQAHSSSHTTGHSTASRVSGHSITTSTTTTAAQWEPIMYIGAGQATDATALWVQYMGPIHMKVPSVVTDSGGGSQCCCCACVLCFPSAHCCATWQHLIPQDRPSTHTMHPHNTPIHP